MSDLYLIGRKAAKNSEPGAYILNVEAAEIIGRYERGTKAWKFAIKEFVRGHTDERLLRQSK